jgi:hypothetical protein
MHEIFRRILSLSDPLMGVEIRNVHLFTDLNRLALHGPEHKHIEPVFAA